MYLITLLCATLHELMHIFFIYLFSGEVSSINLSLIGANIKRCSSLVLSNSKEAIISISAPIFNIAMFIIFYNSTETYKIFSNVNLTLGLVNLLPFYSFDGGCFLKYLLLSGCNAEKTDKILTVVSMLTLIVLVMFSIRISFINKNIHSSVLLCLFMVLSLVFKK